MEKTLQIQSQIRNNAEELSSYLTDITKWEATMKIEESKGKKVSKQTTNDRDNHDKQPENKVKLRELGTTKKNFLELSSSPPESIKNQLSSDQSTNKGSSSSTNVKINNGDATPAMKSSPNHQQTEITVSRARGTTSLDDCEVREKELGNEAFRRGDLQAAVRAYTRCLGLKAQNTTAFANRAAAYLKLKDFSRAELDCSCALSIDPLHFKSLLRRACARNALGKHRQAYHDLTAAMEIEPFHAECVSEKKKTCDLIRSSVYKAPSISVTLQRQPTTTDTDTEDIDRVSSETGIPLPTAELASLPFSIVSASGPNLPFSLLL